MMKKILFVILFASATIFAQQHNTINKSFTKSVTISGKISDIITKEFLTNVQIVAYIKDFENGTSSTKVKGNKTLQATVINNIKFYEFAYTFSDEFGQYELELEQNIEYRIIAYLDGYTAGVTKLEATSSSTKSILFEIENQEVLIDSANRMLLNIPKITFEINQSKLTKGAKFDLDKVCKLLEKYEEMELEIGVHSSSLGSDDFNLKLSEKRANAILAYLKVREVNNLERVTATGYGETQLLNECANGVKCKTIDHKKNKRIEFVVTKNYGLDTIKHANYIVQD